MKLGVIMANSNNSLFKKMAKLIIDKYSNRQFTKASSSAHTHKQFLVEGEIPQIKQIKQILVTPTSGVATCEEFKTKQYRNGCSVLSSNWTKFLSLSQLSKDMILPLKFIRQAGVNLPLESSCTSEIQVWSRFSIIRLQFCSMDSIKSFRKRLQQTKIIMNQFSQNQIQIFLKCLIVLDQTLLAIKKHFKMQLSPYPWKLISHKSKQLAPVIH